MELSVVTNSGKTAAMQVSDAHFAVPFNEAVIHQVVIAQMAAARQGTKAQKTRAEVRGGGRKPWKQKGTGRARAGTIRSPLWRGGGTTFAAKPRDFTQKINKKVYRLALRSIFSELIRQNRLVVVDGFKVEKPKTKELVAQLKKLELEDALLIVDQEDNNLQLAARNLPHVAVCLAPQVEPVDLLSFKKIAITQNAIKALEGRLQ